MLRCGSCGREYEEGRDEPWRCTCGHALDFETTPRPRGRPPSFSTLDTQRGLWAFEDFLPVREHVTLGEGMTPLVQAPAWNAAFKLEYVSPTGSFKDRGAAVLVSRAMALGVDRVIDDSSGNAGAAIATYAARAGIDAEIYVPAAAAKSKIRAIERTGARIISVEGSREAVTAACVDHVENSDGWYASHAWRPAFYAGTATFAIELAAQRNWSVPDVVVCPVGHGTLLLGAYRGFRSLAEAGWIDAVPRFFAAQAQGYAALLDEVTGETNTLADGIQIGSPARLDQLQTVIETTGGHAVAVSEEETRAASERLGQAGFGVEPTSAVAPPALEILRDDGAVSDDSDVVVPLTGRGK